MKRIIKLCLFTFMIITLTACVGNTTTPTPLPATPTIDPFFKSRGIGEPRSVGYWLLWNACAADNKAEVAAANGGREAGWFLMDDLLANPRIQIGIMSVETCNQGVNLLHNKDLQGSEMKNDVAYLLAAQLLTAQLNLAVGSEHCTASDQAVNDAQLLLLELNFDGTGNYLGPPLASPIIDKANELVEQLASYNIGELCR